MQISFLAQKHIKRGAFLRRSMAKISVVVPACNEEKYLEPTIKSILQQDFPDFEAIVVCNGCTDNTEKIARRFESEKLKVINFKEGHVSKARNIGAQKASGDTLLFLDADCTLEKDALSKVHAQFGEEQGVATTKVLPDNSGLKYRFATGFKNFYHVTGLFHGCSGALICRREDFDKVDGYDANIIVKEHRKLILKLERHTGKRFKCIDTAITTSMRRFEKWGLIKASLFWIKEWAKNYYGDLSTSKYEKIR